MVARAGHYYGNPFKGHRGVTQVYPLSPTIFNMVVDAVIRHRVTLVVGEEAGTDGFGRAIQFLAEFFYADDGLLASPRTSRIQAALDVSAVLFNRMVLQTDIKKWLGFCVSLATFSAVTQMWCIFGG